MILACHSISKSYGAHDVLKDIQFHIEAKEKTAVIGINGAGKTTLLKILTGELSPDSGTIELAKDITIGYLPQQPEHTADDHTVYETLLAVKQDIIDLDCRMRQTELEMKHADGERLELLYRTYERLTHAFERANGYAYKSEISGVLNGLGFTQEQYDQPISTLSGGQKTRIALGAILLQKPDILLLDEPTNHLDTKSIAWLESYLGNYEGAVLLVSHDRYFLDRIVTKVLELERGTCRTYHGNYSYYAAKREEIRNNEWKNYQNQQAAIQHQAAVIAKLRSFNREKSVKRAESREKLLNKMERIEKPTELKDSMRIRLEPETESGYDVLFMEHISKSFDQVTLFQDITIDIKRGERVALIGDNGTGKTTILKLINQLLPKDSGSITLGSRVTIGYYDQEHQVLSPDKTIFQEISDAYPALNHTRIRTILAAFLFMGDDVFKKIHDLSGGEQGRVALAKLMLSSANFLILDEPTNHLDIPSKEILESALCNYTGTVLYVSHDRYFINKTATRILDLTGQHLNEYKGNYDYYLEKRDTVEQAYASAHPTANDPADPALPAANDATTGGSKAEWQAKKQEQAQQRKKENHIKKIEAAISQLEDQIHQINEELCKPEIATNAELCLKFTTEQQEANMQLDRLYDEWEALSE